MKIVLPTKPTIMAHKFEDLISLFYGPPGCGKTTFVNGLADSVLFLSTDRGTRNLLSQRIECLGWEKCLAMLDACEKKGAPQYDIFCIDHVDDWARMGEDFILQKLGVESLTDKRLPYGKGWNLYKKELRMFLRRILKLGCTPVFIAHETIKKVTTDGQELDKYMPSLGKSAWDLLIPMIDIIGFITLKRVKKGDHRVDAHMLKTLPTQDVYGKDRSRRVKPDKKWEPLDPEAFLASFKKLGKRAKVS
jgi:hypothetical protein